MRRWLWGLVGVAFGACTALLELVYVLCAALVLLWPRSRALAFRGARALVELERRRLAHYFGSSHADQPDGARALQYLALRGLVGLLGGVLLLLLGYGAVGSVVEFRELWTSPHPLEGRSSGEKFWLTVYLAVFCAVMGYLALAGLIGVSSLDRALARRFLEPDRAERLQRRVEELSVTRADVVAAIREERRRIERDLHDGVQQRLVALGLLIGRARRAGDGERTAELLAQAHQESQEVLRDFRDVAWRVYPAALDAGGLHPALEALAERAGMRVELHYAVESRPEIEIEAVAYFVVSEAVTNAAKHADARIVSIRVQREGRWLVAEISDDGAGGAVADGAGLSGLARRVAALDGRFTVDSPVGGPTVITAELPCA
ncbi:Signal transduction histidine kinase [Saccharopolyspora antimicrobica]|uniref:histidine kinase n=1 Tax=Saccharopolyspora antimicrobica TaxID=455193 RepID=A0A1I4VCM6_9PSEU|nr:histidine kinase [Saccharopolyspora antimicrobica]RKT86231.1 signal transduction histidine kinase [Saccharopolyspora antimicrobica]SFM98928.1 Signal transduction histidine kinase [Saccharopolyspora antimicrobica]